MRIAHVGVPLTRAGGPAGYLLQLRDALAASSRRHTVTFPDEVPANAPAVSRRTLLTSRIRGRLRYLVTGRKTHRPPLSARLQANGSVGRAIANAFRATSTAAEA